MTQVEYSSTASHSEINHPYTVANDYMKENR